MDVMINL